MTDKNIKFINQTAEEISETFNKISKAIDIATISIKEFGETVSKIREEEKT